jgi:hypothetical protein
MAGKNGGTWRHDYVPTNMAAAILKAHGSKTTARKELKKPLRKMNERQLLEHYDRPDVGNSGHAVKATLAEMQRRENASRRAAATTSRRQAAQSAHRDHLEGHFVAAENTTRGNLVNKAGRAKGIDGRSLLTANAATRGKYASDELKSYLDSNPVLSSRDFAAYHAGSQGAAVQSARRSTMRTRYGVY